jgi:hypothetical protein
LGSNNKKASEQFFDVRSRSRSLCRAPRLSSLLTPPSLKHITAQQKHDILIHVRDRRDAAVSSSPKPKRSLLVMA